MIGMRFEGGEALAKAFRDLPEAFGRKTLQAGLTDAAEPMRASMEQLAPRAPGKPDIADHMVVSPMRRYFDPDDSQFVKLDETSAAVAVGPVKGFFWGMMLEYGTVKMAPQPFARNSFDAHRDGVLRSLTTTLWRALTRAVAGRGASPGGTGGL